jgi:hypothetical protein
MKLSIKFDGSETDRTIKDAVGQLLSTNKNI